MNPAVDPYFYHAEAALASDRDCYVERPADAELFKALKAGKYSCLLSSRKVGKSSLLERTFVRLSGAGVFVAKKELAEGDEVVSEESWYAGLVEELVNEAERRNRHVIGDGWREWWEERRRLPAGQRFTDFLRTYFLEPTTHAWVIAIDEIDTTIPLPFSDDFFAAIRRCQNARAADPVFNRLTFLLSGVATPTQLIKDNRRTPFNIGHTVALTDFTPKEAKVLLRGLGQPEEADHPALLRVLHWTGGHPYLTQRIFTRVAEDLEAEPASGPVDWETRVDAAVQGSFLAPGSRSKESHLQDIARRRIGDLDKPDNPNRNPNLKRGILGVYGRALRGESVKDDSLSAPVVELKLCGLLVPKSEDPERLAIRNRIYRAVFDEAWVRSETPKDTWRVTAIAALLVGALALGSIPVLQRNAEKKEIAILVQAIESADTDVPTPAVDKLGRIKGQEANAKRLMAEYWTKQARRASVERPRDEAVILWLKALSIAETEEARRGARRSLAGSDRNIAITIRHGGPIRSAAFSPDGRRVVTASQDNTARVWNIESGRPLGKALVHQSLIHHAEFSLDGRRVVTASSDSTAQVWDIESGSPVGKALVHVGPVWHAEFSPDGRRVVTASSDRTAQVWDIESGSPVGKALAHGGPVLHAAFSPDSRRVVTASTDSTARVWDAESGSPVGKALVHGGPLSHATFSPDGRRVLTASDDSTARVWDVESGNPVGEALAHQDFVGHAAFSPDGLRVVTSSYDFTAQVWDVESGKPAGKALVHEGSVKHAEFSPDGLRVVTSSSDSTARVWDVKSSKPVGKAFVHEAIVDHAAFSPDGLRVATSSRDHTARVWDVESFKSVGNDLVHQHCVLHATFSPDGHRVVTSSKDGTAQIWDIESGSPVGKTLAHNGFVYRTEFSLNGRRIVTASEDSTARVWDVESGSPVGKALAHDGPVYHAAFSPDGRQIVTASKGRIARVWDLESGNPVGKALVHDGPVYHAEFSPDGRRVVTASDDRTVRVWDVKSGAAVGIWVHDGVVLHAAFSPDGRRVVAGSEDKTARVWDVESGGPVGNAMIHDGSVSYAAFSSDGNHLITQAKNALHRFIETSSGEWRVVDSLWTEGDSWASEAMAMTTNANRLKVAEYWTGDIIVIREISLSEPDPNLSELPGKAADMLRDYLRRFSLAFEDETKSPRLVPRYPVTVPDAQRSPKSPKQ